MIFELSDNTLTILVAAGAAVIVAVAGAVLTETGAWYKALDVPSWKPPDWAFGPIWTSIFVLIAIAGVWAWNSADTPGERTALLAAFGVNAILNIAWSYFFFTLRRPDWALVEVGVFWVSIVVLIAVVWPLNAWAGALLIPYLAWVSLASVLNYEIVRRNGPFGAKAMK